MLRLPEGFRTAWALLMAGILMLTFTACGQQGPTGGAAPTPTVATGSGSSEATPTTGGEGGSTSTATPGASTGTGTSKLKVAYVSDVGGINDKGYNQYVYEGTVQGTKEIGADPPLVIESKSPTDYARNIGTAASQADLIIVAGFAMADAIKQASSQYPDKKFAIIDYSYDPPLPNVQGDVFAANEGSYLGGIVAAGISKKHIIGFVGGVQVPVLEEFLAGYEAGAVAQDPNVRILVGWTGSFEDQQKGKETAQAMIAQGADVIYTAAGASGLGAITAAKEAGIWAIGVDQDQNYIAPDTIITSVVKRVDVAARDNIISAANGTWQSGTKLFNLANGGVGLAPYHELASQVPQAVQDAVKKAEEDIKSGAIKVPTEPPYPNGK